jgi:hypothetical protein
MKQRSYGSDQSVGFWLEHDGSRWPLPEGAVDGPAMKDEGYTPVRQTAADSRAIGVPQVEIQHGSRQVRMICER